MGMGQYLKELISDKRITIKELSTISGVPLNSLYSITKRDPETLSVGTAQRLSEALNVPAESFLSSRDENSLAKILTQKMEEADMPILDLAHYSRIPLNRLKNMLSGITRISADDEFQILKSINYYRRMRLLDEDTELFNKLGTCRPLWPFFKITKKELLLHEFEDMLQKLDADSLKILIFIADSMVKAKQFEDENRNPHRFTEEEFDELYDKLTAPDDSDE